MFILALPSAAYIGYVFYNIRRRTIPAWLGRWFKIQRGRKKEAAETMVDLCKKTLTWAYVIALYILFSTFNRGWEYWIEKSIIWFGVYMTLMVIGALVIQRHIDYIWGLHQELKHQDEFEEIVERHNPVRWATDKDIEKVFPNPNTLTYEELSSVNIGGHYNFKLHQKGHGITIGNARSGKGSSLLAYQILDEALIVDNAPSFVVLDVRGELLSIAGRSLKEKGYNLIVLNPYNIAEISQFGNVRFNPFDLFDAETKDFNKHVDLIRYAIMPTDSGPRHANSYFGEAASDLLSLYIRHMMTQDEEKKNITTLYRWLRLGGDDRAKLLGKMEQNDRFDVSHDSKGVLQQLLDGSKSISDVYGNVTVAVGAFRDEQIRDAMSKTEFHFKELSAQKTALFICLGPEDMERMKPWMRLVVSSLMRTFLRHYNTERKIVMLLDEFYSLGRVSEFANLQILANYNVTAHVVVQDLGQLKTLYPAEWEGFINNSFFRHWLGIGDNFTAEYLSKRLGNTLMYLGKHSDGTPNYKETPFMTPAEIMKFPDIIVEASGVEKPIVIVKKPYWNYFNPNDFDANPFYRK